MKKYLSFALLIVLSSLTILASGLCIAGTTDLTGVYTDITKLPGFSSKVDSAIFFKRCAELFSTAGKGELYLPAGEYRVSRGFIEFMDLRKLIIRGDGPEKTKIVFEESINTGRPFRIRDIDFLEIRDLSIECNQPKISMNCLDIMVSKNVLIERCSFKGASFYGIGMYEDTFTKKRQRVESATIRDNTFENIGVIGLETFPKIKSGILAVYNNKFVRCGYNALGLSGGVSGCAMKPGQNFESSAVYNNNIYDCAGGINVANWEGIEIYDNQLINIEKFAIAVSVTTHPNSYVPGHKKLIIRNNTIDNANMSKGSRYSAISINGTINNNGPIVVASNTISGSYSGIEVRPSVTLKNISLTNNKIENLKAGPAIWVQGRQDSVIATEDMKIIGNRFTNNNLMKKAPKIVLRNNTGLMYQQNKMINVEPSEMKINNNKASIIEE